jgi:hypothetical protein
MLPPPPKRPKPDAFYLEHVPAFWQALIDGAGLPPLRVTVQVEITRDQRESLTYVVTLDDGVVRSRAGETEVATITLSFDMEAYRTATRDLWPRAARRLEATADRTRQRLGDIFTDVDTNAWLATLLELPGELELEHTDDAGDTSLTRVAVGTGPGARARVVSSDADASLLLEGKSSLLQLLKSRATIEGDSGWVLRLVTRLQPTRPA